MRRPVASATVVGALLLAGCSGEPDATGPTLPPITAAPSPTASAALPELPPEAQGDDADAATAFAQYYFQTVVVEAAQTNDTGVLRSLSHPECGTCANLIAATEAQREAGERLEGTDYDIIGAAAPAVEGDEIIVDIRYATGSGRLFGPEGEVEEIPSSPPADAQVLVIRDGERWLVRALRFLEEDGS